MNPETCETSALDFASAEQAAPTPREVSPEVARAQARLDDIVAELSADELDCAAALDLFEEAVKLGGSITTVLDEPDAFAGEAEAAADAAAAASAAADAGAADTPATDAASGPVGGQQGSTPPPSHGGSAR